MYWTGWMLQIFSDKTAEERSRRQRVILSISCADNASWFGSQVMKIMWLIPYHVADYWERRSKERRFYFYMDCFIRATLSSLLRKRPMPLHWLERLVKSTAWNLSNTPSNHSGSPQLSPPATKIWISVLRHLDDLREGPSWCAAWPHLTGRMSTKRLGPKVLQPRNWSQVSIDLCACPATG